jgi:hypothetical protein
MTYKKTLIYNLQNHAFTIFIVLSYILYAISVFGLSKNAPKYIQTLDSYVKIYICLYLVYRYNPLRKWIFKQKFEFTELDRKIVYSSAMFILATTAINSYAIRYLSKFKDKIMHSPQQNNTPLHETSGVNTNIDTSSLDVSGINAF